MCHDEACDRAGAAFKEGFPEGGTFGLRSREKNIPGRGDSLADGRARKDVRPGWGAEREGEPRARGG